MANPKPLLSSVYIDTNALRAVGFAMQAPWLEKLIQIGAEYRIRLCVPRLVLDEWCQFLTCDFEDRLRKAVQNIDHAKKLTEYEGDLPDFEGLRARGTVIAKVQEARLIGLGFVIIPTVRLDFDSLIQQAIRRVPPFQEGDKGFRDVVILESIASYASQEFPGSQVIIASKDKGMGRGLHRITSAGLDGLLVDFEDAADRASSEYMSRAWDHVTDLGRREAEHVKQFESQVFAAIREAGISSAYFILDQATLGEGSYIDGIVACLPQGIEEAYPGRASLLPLELSADRYPIRLEVSVQFTLAVRDSGGVLSLFSAPTIPASKPGKFELPPFQEPTVRAVELTRSVSVDTSVSRDGVDQREYKDFRIEHVGLF